MRTDWWLSVITVYPRILSSLISADLFITVKCNSDSLWLLVDFDFSLCQVLMNLHNFFTLSTTQQFLAPPTAFSLTGFDIDEALGKRKAAIQRWVENTPLLGVIMWTLKMDQTSSLLYDFSSVCFMEAVKGNHSKLFPLGENYSNFMTNKCSSRAPC